LACGLVGWAQCRIGAAGLMGIAPELPRAYPETSLEDAI